MDIENTNQSLVPIEGSSQNQSSSPEDQPKQSKKFIIILGIILALFAFGAGGYFLGVNKNQTETQSKQVTVSPTSTQPYVSTSAPRDNSREYITYQYDTFHIGTPVFQVQIPSNWSASHTYRGYREGKVQAESVHFGESHYELQPGIVSEVPSLIQIRLKKDPELSKKDPADWSADETLDVFGASGGFNWSNTTVGGLPAKITSFGGARCNDRVVLLTQNDLIFSFYVPVCEDEKTDPLLLIFNHMLATFKILNPDPDGL